MTQNASDPAAEDGAGDVRYLGGLEQSGHSAKPPINQRGPQGITYQRVTGSVGPIHLIGGPRVVVERHISRAFVWVENPIWGWPDAQREFLSPESPAIFKYAQALALRIRDAAHAEEARRSRIDAARKQEAAARLAEWEKRK